MIHAREDYNRIQDPAGLIPADEPVFLLRAQDELACTAVSFYAALCLQAQAPEIADKAAQHAHRMAAWPKKKVPDLSPVAAQNGAAVSDNAGSAPEVSDKAMTTAASEAFNNIFFKCRAEVSMLWWQRIWKMAVEWARSTEKPEPEPIAWEATTIAYTRYITDSRYQKFSPEARRWYKPYRCSNCNPAASPVKWFNGCDRTVPEALRFLANNERPSHGESRFNAAHLLQLAGEIERMAAMPLPAASPTDSVYEAAERHCKANGIVFVDPTNMRRLVDSVVAATKESSNAHRV